MHAPSGLRGALARRVPEFGGSAPAGCGKGAGVAGEVDASPDRGLGEVSGVTRLAQAFSGEAAPVSPALRQSSGRSGKTSSTVQTGRSGKRQPTEAEAHFLHRPFPTPARSPGFAVRFASRLCSRLRASYARIRPPLSHNPLARGTQEAPPSSRDSLRGGCSPSRKCACTGTRALPIPPTETTSTSDALAPVGANGLSRNKPRQPSTQAPLHTQGLFSTTPFQTPEETLLQDFSSHSLLVESIAICLLQSYSSSLQGRAPG